MRRTAENLFCLSNYWHNHISDSSNDDDVTNDANILQNIRYWTIRNYLLNGTQTGVFKRVRLSPETKDEKLQLGRFLHGFCLLQRWIWIGSNK
jgi:hypothetical protein